MGIVYMKKGPEGPGVNSVVKNMWAADNNSGDQHKQGISQYGVLRRCHG